MLRSFSLEPDEAEEVAQAVFMRAWRGLGRFEGRAQLSTWLYRIAFNEAQRCLSRRRPVHAPRGAGGREAIDELTATSSDGPLALALQRELTRNIWQAINRLPAEWRAAVVLRDVQGLSTDEAAVVVGVGPAAFKSRLHRGRMQLRSLLAPYLDV